MYYNNSIKLSKIHDGHTLIKANFGGVSFNNMFNHYTLGIYKNMIVKFVSDEIAVRL